MRVTSNDDSVQALISDMRVPLRDLYISPIGISPYSDGSLHCTEVEREKTDGGYMLRLRVITNNHRSVRITVPCDSDYEYKRFLLLRNRIRNTDLVLVTFDTLRVSTSSHGLGELYLYANNYTAVVSDEDGSNLEF